MYAELGFFAARSTQNRRFLVALLAILLAPAAFADSTARFLDPDGLFKPATFSQIAITKGDTVVFISGQTARDEKSVIVGAGDVKKAGGKSVRELAHRG